MANHLYGRVLMLLLPVATGGSSKALVSGLHANGLLEVRLGSAFASWDERQLEKLERTLDCADASAILLLTTSTEASDPCPAAPSRSLAIREHGMHAFLAEAARNLPVLALSNGPLSCAPATSLFMTVPTRVCTGRTTLALPECRLGRGPRSGTLSFLRRELAPHMALFTALTGVRLNSHDCIGLGLATHFVCTDSVLALLDEMRCAPAGYLDVPLARRATPPPDSLASLFATDVHELLDEALRRAFGDRASSVADVRKLLDEERERVGDMLRSCGWRTRERAEAVADVLDAAALALKRSSPHATQATFNAIRLCWRDGFSDYDTRELELSLQTELGGDGL
jgi:enoyl-CoA hydratase/carnithine racemase